MQRLVLLKVLLLLTLVGCNEESVSYNQDVGAPIPSDSSETIEIPNDEDICHVYYKNGTKYKIEFFENIISSGNIVKTVGYYLNQDSTAIVLHNPCGPAYEYTTPNGEPWQQSWLYDGEFSRKDDLPSYVSYFNYEGKFYIFEESWISGSEYSERVNDTANHKIYTIASMSGDRHRLKREEWRKGGGIDFTGKGKGYIFHRPRSHGSAINDYTWLPEITYDWMENNQLIKHKVVNKETNRSLCVYYIDNNKYSDENCEAEDLYDQDFGFE